MNPDVLNLITPTPKQHNLEVFEKVFNDVKHALTDEEIRKLMVALYDIIQK